MRKMIKDMIIVCFIHFPFLSSAIILISCAFYLNLYSTIKENTEFFIAMIFILQGLFYLVFFLWDIKKKNVQRKKYLKETNFLVAM